MLVAHFGLCTVLEKALGYGIIIISLKQCASFLWTRQQYEAELDLNKFLYFEFRQRIVTLSLSFQTMNLMRSLFIVLCLLFLSKTYADTTAVDEYKIRAGYLFNFTKFITWANTNSESFNICILGNDPFGELIDPIEQRTAFNLPIKLFRLTAINKEQHCHIVYLSAGMNARLAGANVKNMLVVGEENIFVTQGGMIAFVKKEDKIKLHINLKLLQQSGLKVSAKLLEVSEIVGGNQ